MEQKTSGLGKGLITIAKTLAMITPVLLSTVVQAQVPCNSVSSIGINTGYDYNTSTTITGSMTDPEWRITYLTPACAAVPGGVPIGSNAIHATNAWSANDPNSTWVSFINSGLYNTVGSQPDTAYGMVLSRTFTVCQDDSFSFDLRLANDNFCSNIDVDGMSSGFSQPAGMPTANHTTFTTVPTFAFYLTAGVHTISLTCYNFPITSINGHGLNLLGTIQSVNGNNSLVGPGSPQNCVCMTPPKCSDSCYWKVTGNNILNNNNIFGTLSQDHVRIQTSSTDRGIFTADGLLGWNTMSPTAYLHVYCDGHNKEDGFLSDVRFEKLESGDGNVLVINDAGYVLDSRIRLSDIAALKQLYETEKEDNAKMRTELQEIKAQLNTLMSKQQGVTSTSKLYQNTPNPFGKETSIRYYIDQIKTSAFIAIYDLNGKELNRQSIARAGDGAIKINAGQLSRGMYLYALVVDGSVIDTKRMTLSE